MGDDFLFSNIYYLLIMNIIKKLFEEHLEVYKGDYYTHTLTPPFTLRCILADFSVSFCLHICKHICICYVVLSTLYIQFFTAFIHLNDILYISSGHLKTLGKHYSIAPWYLIV